MPVFISLHLNVKLELLDWCKSSNLLLYCFKNHPLYKCVKRVGTGKKWIMIAYK